MPHSQSQPYRGSTYSATDFDSDSDSGEDSEQPRKRHKHTVNANPPSSAKPPSNDKPPSTGKPPSTDKPPTDLQIVSREKEEAWQKRWDRMEQERTGDSATEVAVGVTKPAVGVHRCTSQGQAVESNVSSKW